MLEIITILLIIILSPVIVFAGFLVLGLIVLIITGLVAGLIMGTTELVEWIADKLKK